MGIYFEEITYDEEPLVWEVNSENRAVATHILKRSSQRIVPLLTDKLDSKVTFSGIVYEAPFFKINDLNNFITTHSLKPIACEERIPHKQGESLDTNKIGLEERKSLEDDNSQTKSSRSFSFFDQQLTEKPQLRKAFSFSPSKNPIVFRNSVMSLENMIKKESTLWGTTLAYLSLPASNERDLDAIMKFPVATESQLIHIQHLECSLKTSKLKSQRIQLLIKLVDDFFGAVVKQNKISEEELVNLKKFILKSVASISSNEGLDRSLDHEKYYQDNNALNLTKEHLERIATSKKLEIDRSVALASPFAFHNLPQYLSEQLETLDLKTVYIQTYDEICDNLFKTGRQLRENKRELKTFEEAIKNNNFEHGKFISIDEIIKLLIPVEIYKQLLPVGKKITGGFLKSSHAPVSPVTLLKNKIIEALVEANEHPHINLHKTDSLISTRLSALNCYKLNQKLFIKNEYAESFVKLLRKEFKFEEVENDIKLIAKHIESYKVKHLECAFEVWINQFKETSTEKVNYSY